MTREPLNDENGADPSNQLHPPNQGSKLFEKACRSHQKGDINSAVQLYQQAVQTDPTIQSAWRNLGALLRQQGKSQEARHCTEQALKLDSNDGSLWGNYGNVLRDQGLLEESCKAFREGLQRTPNSKGLLQGLAISLGQCGDHQQVVELVTPVVDEALAKLGSGDNSLAELLLELGNAHHSLGEKDQALRRWREGIKGAEGEKRLFIGLTLPKSCAETNGSRKQINYAKTSSPYFLPTKTWFMRKV